MSDPNPDPSNTEDIDTLTAPIDDDDDVHELVSIVDPNACEVVDNDEPAEA